MTLIELLIAISLLAIVTTLAYRGLDTLSRSSERLLADNERWQVAALFFARFATDVAQAAPRPIRTGMATPASANDALLPAWQGEPLPALDAADDSPRAPLEFTRMSSTGHDAVRLAYRLRAHRLELLIWPVLDRMTRDAGAPSARPRVYVLLEDVLELHLHYLDAAGSWLEHWPPQDKLGTGLVGGDPEQLPRAVKIELMLANGIRLQRVFALPS